MHLIRLKIQYAQYIDINIIIHNKYYNIIGIEKKSNLKWIKKPNKWLLNDNL